MTEDQRFELSSQALGALPIVSHFLSRLGLETTLERYLPSGDVRVLMAAARSIRVLILNLCLEREPLYGIGEWAERFDPAALGVESEEVALLCDDRVGRALDQLFDCDRASLLNALVLRAIGEFQVDCSQLHNDSTAITLYERVALSPVIGPVERLLLGVFRVDPEQEQRWTAYAWSLVCFSAAKLADPVSDPSHPGDPSAQPTGIHGFRAVGSVVQHGIVVRVEHELAVLRRRRGKRHRRDHPIQKRERGYSQLLEDRGESCPRSVCAPRVGLHPLVLLAAPSPQRHLRSRARSRGLDPRRYQ